MKRFLPLIALLSLWLGVCAYAQIKTTYSQRDVRDPRKLAANLEALAGNVSDVTSDLSDLEDDVAAQTDAATTTDTTDYTPVYIGQLLIGKVGNTNSVWVARTVSTNGWQKIAP